MYMHPLKKFLMLEPIFTKLSTYIMPPEAISTAHFINISLSSTNITAFKIFEAKP
jgi:hypothetical protein